VTTLAGTAHNQGAADGPGSTATFSFPTGVAADTAGNVYVSDDTSIRKIAPGGVVSTISSAAGGGPLAIAADAASNLYVANWSTHTISTVSGSGVVTTIAGEQGSNGSADGVGAAARFNSPMAIAADAAGNIFVADSGNVTIREISPARIVTTIAGLAGVPGTADGSGASARFVDPCAIAVDGTDNLYVGDCGSNTIRKITPSGLVSTIVGIPGSQGVTLGALPGSLNSPPMSQTISFLTIVTDLTVPFGMGIAVLPGSPVRLVVTQSAESAVLIVTPP
jgi:hypothetical protein